ncbi:MAG: hypothetical protein JWM19_2842 [Actinomycetia bacterium]|nr:hypothetical protein [Actinomycetes bacterium]
MAAATQAGSPRSLGVRTDAGVRFSCVACRGASAGFCAVGLHPLEAGVGLLIANGSFLRRSDFISRFILHGTSSGTRTAAVDWQAATTALAAGELPCTGKRRVLLLSASLAGGIPVDLRDATTGIDGYNVQRLIRVIWHASGMRPGSWGTDDRF